MIQGRQQHEQQLEMLKQEHELQQSQQRHAQNMELRSLETTAKLGQSWLMSLSLWLLLGHLLLVQLLGWLIIGQLLSQLLCYLLLLMIFLDSCCLVVLGPFVWNVGSVVNLFEPVVVEYWQVVGSIVIKLSCQLLSQLYWQASRWNIIGSVVIRSVLGSAVVDLVVVGSVMLGSVIVVERWRSP